MAVQSALAAVSQLINAANVSRLNLVMSATPGASQPFSISVWIRANWGTSAAPIGRTSMVGLYGPATAPTSALQIGTTLGQGELSCWTWGGAIVVGMPPDFMTQYNNVWVNISYTYNGTTHRLYLNGPEIATSITAQLVGNLQAITINGFPTGAANETGNHIVDSYFLWGRTLSANEILTIYNAQGARHGIEYQIIASYEFDEGIEASNAVQVLDQSGNGLNLLFAGTGATPKYVYGSTYAGSNIRPVIIT